MSVCMSSVDVIDRCVVILRRHKHWLTC